jgi:hypothetical protein
MRRAGREAKHASVPLRRVRAGEARVRSFSTNSRPALRAASGRPPARQRRDGHRATGLTLRPGQSQSNSGHASWAALGPRTIEHQGSAADNHGQQTPRSAGVSADHRTSKRRPSSSLKATARGSSPWRRTFPNDQLRTPQADQAQGVLFAFQATVFRLCSVAARNSVSSRARSAVSASGNRWP